jgi:N-acetylneuraminate synthase/sialic acid synthase
MVRIIRLADRTISDEGKCFVIAEIGHNHQGDLEICKKMFLAAKESGADAVKLQKRNNKSLYTSEFYNSPYNSENAYGSTYGLHREALEFGWSEYLELKAYAQELGIIFFATAFDMKSADFLAKLDVPCFKIASADLNNLPLLKYVSSFGKPMIISTGGGTLDEVRRAFEWLNGGAQFAFLHCTAMYPVTDDQEDKMNLRVIQTMRDEFPDTVIGLSDHSNGVAFATAAYVLGARIIEKHFTLKRTMRGTDHAFSLEPSGMAKLTSYLNRLYVGLGDGIKKRYSNENGPLMKMGKKIVAADDFPAGHIIKMEDMEFRSPADGMPPYLAESLVGEVLKKDIAKGETFKTDHIK